MRKPITVIRWHSEDQKSPCRKDCPDRKYDGHVAGHCKKWDEWQKQRSENNGKMEAV